MRQLSYQRSNHSLGFPAVFGLFLWATGCARQTIEALHNCGLSVSYTSVLNNISALADHCIQLAVAVGSGPHIFCYDNINLSTSIFVEQRGSSSPAKVTSGTFAVLYKLRNGDLQHMKLAPIMERFKKVKGLNFNQDLRPTIAQVGSLHSQLKIVVIRVLTTFCSSFSDYAKLPEVQHQPRRRLQKGHITEQFPLRATTIEEATVLGNLLFHDDVYVTQLKRSPDGLSEYAIPSFNDQLTNARIRSAQQMRQGDVNAWERREVFQLGFGLFHLCLNLVWALLHIHRGSLNQIGSLAYWFALLEKTRLGADHPDYHTLLATLTQILNGLILNAWRIECGKPSLTEFASSKPSVAKLSRIAEKIIRNHATPMVELGTIKKEETDSDCEAGEEQAIQHQGSRSRKNEQIPPPVKVDLPNPDRDRVHQNIRILTRDLLYLSELIQAISDGDIGRIEDILPQLAIMFRGAGGNNYCTEILYFILHLKYVWTSEFA